MKSGIKQKFLAISATLALSFSYFLPSILAMDGEVHPIGEQTNTTQPPAPRYDPSVFTYPKDSGYTFMQDFMNFYDYWLEVDSAKISQAEGGVSSEDTRTAIKNLKYFLDHDERFYRDVDFIVNSQSPILEGGRFPKEELLYVEDKANVILGGIPHDVTEDYRSFTSTLYHNAERTRGTGRLAYFYLGASLILAKLTLIAM